MNNKRLQWGLIARHLDEARICIDLAFEALVGKASPTSHERYIKDQLEYLANQCDLRAADARRQYREVGGKT